MKLPGNGVIPLSGLGARLPYPARLFTTVLSLSTWGSFDELTLFTRQELHTWLFLRPGVQGREEVGHGAVVLCLPPFPVLGVGPRACSAAVPSLDFI